MQASSLVASAISGFKLTCPRKYKSWVRSLCRGEPLANPRWGPGARAYESISAGSQLLGAPIRPHSEGNLSAAYRGSKVA